MSVRMCLAVLAGLCLCCSESSAAEPVLDTKLLRKTSLKPNGKLLLDVIKELSTTQKIAIEVEPELAKNLSDVKVDVIASVNGVTLQSALSLLLESADEGGFVVDRGTVRVLGYEASESQTSTVTHSLRPIGPLAQFPGELSDCIQMCTSLMWTDIDGAGGSIVGIDPRSIRIEQTLEGQRKIADLLQQIGATVQGRKLRGSPIDTANERISKTLARVVNPAGGEMPLPEALESLLGKNRLSYVVFSLFAEEAGIDLQSTVTIERARKPLGEHLTSILEPLGLTAIVKHEVVTITSRDLASFDHVTTVYNASRHLSGTVAIDDVLANVMRATGTGPWEEIDGEGGVVISLGPLLIVKHNRDGHKKIAELLETR